MYTYLNLVVGSVVKVNVNGEEKIGHVEWICKDGQNRFAMIRDANDRSTLVNLSDCKLYRIKFSKEYFDVHGNAIEEGAILS
ncbi:hypothetical protein AALB53_13950 [Lachnospiraceae bacterium 47-T17]